MLITSTAPTSLSQCLVERLILARLLVWIPFQLPCLYHDQMPLGSTGSQSDSVVLWLPHRDSLILRGVTPYLSLLQEGFRNPEPV